MRKENQRKPYFYEERLWCIIYVMTLTKIIQKDIKELETYLAKYKEYNQKIHTCGERSSYSKTDNDAIFMRMKEDHLGTGQLEKHQKMAKKKTYEYG